jgi:hypothetical protein
MRRRVLITPAAVLLTASLALAGCSAATENGGSQGGRAAVAGSNSEADQQSANGTASNNGGAGSAAATGRASGSGGADSKTSGLAPSSIVRTATLTVQAKNVPDALERAHTLVSGAGGYVGEENTSLDGKGLEHSRLQLRVPPGTYDRVLSDLAGLGKLLGQTVEAQDVTGQVVDVQSRIKTQQASVARVRDLMDRATRLSDIVTLEGQLSSREAALESLEAQQASLKERTAMATLTLVLSQSAAKPAPPKPEAADGFWASVGDALSGGWHAFYLAARAVLMALAAALPFAALAALGWLVQRAVRKRLPRGPRPEGGLEQGRGL